MSGDRRMVLRPTGEMTDPHAEADYGEGGRNVTEDISLTNGSGSNGEGGQMIVHAGMHEAGPVVVHPGDREGPNEEQPGRNFFIHAPQYHWHVEGGHDQPARMAIEELGRQTFRFGQYMEGCLRHVDANMNGQAQNQEYLREQLRVEEGKVQRLQTELKDTHEKHAKLQHQWETSFALEQRKHQTALTEQHDSLIKSCAELIDTRLGQQREEMVKENKKLRDENDTLREQLQTEFHRIRMDAFKYTRDLVVDYDVSICKRFADCLEELRGETEQGRKEDQDGMEAQFAAIHSDITSLTEKVDQVRQPQNTGWRLPSPSLGDRSFHSPLVPLEIEHSSSPIPAVEARPQSTISEEKLAAVKPTVQTVVTWPVTRTATVAEGSGESGRDTAWRPGVSLLPVGSSSRTPQREPPPPPPSDHGGSDDGTAGRPPRRLSPCCQRVEQKVPDTSSRSRRLENSMDEHVRRRLVG